MLSPGDQSRTNGSSRAAADITMTKLFGLLVLCAALSSQPHALALEPALGTEDDRAELVAGIESIRTIGSPGSIAVWGADAFVVVAGDGGEGTRAPLIGAGPLGKGRVVLFGHDYLSSQVLADAPTKLLVERLASWAADVKPKQRAKFITWEQDLVGVLDPVRFGVEVARDDWAKELERCDGVLATRHDFDEREIDALRRFVKGGGALLSGKPGWGWKQVTGRELLSNEVNRIVADAGLAFADGFSAPGADDRFTLAEPPRLSHAARAFTTLLGDAKELTPLDRRQSLASLMETLRVLPDADFHLRPSLASLARDAQSARVPTAEHPVTESDSRARLALAFQAVELARAPLDRVVAHPFAASFPGAVPPKAARVKRTVEIDPGVPRWHTTGLYAAPGAHITIDAPNEAVALGLAVQIGVHTDAIWEKPWPRLPEITRRWTLRERRTVVASAFGGLVEIVVPHAQPGARVVITIDGAVEAPRFVLGRDTNETWKRELRARPAPWAELVTSKVVLAVPSSSIRALDDPEELMTFWDQVLDAMADFAAIPRARESAERYVPDVMISAGYMHSGYPIMTFLDAVPDMTSLARMKKGPWGLLHELGHNHQEDEWTFEGTGEVTNNVFVLYVLDTLCKRADWAQGHDALKESEKRFAKYVKQGRKYADWCDDPFLALGMYVELREAFGWEPFTAVFAQYRALKKDERPETEQEKRDQWFTRMSHALGKDLGPFFERWGVPVSEGARTATNALPPWDVKAKR